MAALCSSLTIDQFLVAEPYSLRAQPKISRLPFPGAFIRQSVKPGRSLCSKVLAQKASSEATRRLYVGNIPRTVNNDELTRLFQEHGSVETAKIIYDKYSGRSRRFAFVTMNSEEEASAAIEKLNGTQIGGREIKVNITEKPLESVDLSNVQAVESSFVDSQYKVYVGNLAKTVTSDMLSNFFSEKGKVLGAKVSRVPGTSKSSGFGFVSFSSEEEVDGAISSFNNVRFEGQLIRVNRA